MLSNVAWQRLPEPTNKQTKTNKTKRLTILKQTSDEFTSKRLKRQTGDKRMDSDCLALYE